MATGDKRVISPYNTNGVIETDKNVIDGDVYVKGKFKANCNPYVRKSTGLTHSSQPMVVWGNGVYAGVVPYWGGYVALVNEAKEVLFRIEENYGNKSQVTMDVNTLCAIGCQHLDSDDGKVYIYDLAGVLKQTIKPDTIVTDNKFGTDVRFIGDYLYVASIDKVYRYDFNTTTGECTNEILVDTSGDNHRLIDFQGKLLIVQLADIAQYCEYDLTGVTDISGLAFSDKSRVFVCSDTNLVWISYRSTGVQINADFSTSALPSSLVPINGANQGVCTNVLVRLENSGDISTVALVTSTGTILTSFNGSILEVLPESVAVFNDGTFISGSGASDHNDPFISMKSYNNTDQSTAVVTSSYNMSYRGLFPHTSLNVDTSATEITVTLPYVCARGRMITVSDLIGTFEANNCTIKTITEHTIEGVSEDLVIDVNNASVTLVYNNGNWEVMS